MNAMVILIIIVNYPDIIEMYEKKIVKRINCEVVFHKCKEIFSINISNTKKPNPLLTINIQFILIYTSNSISSFKNMRFTP